MAYSTISKPSLHFNTKLYTGTGSSNALTGVGFQPDWTWIKKRSATGSNSLFDAVRGVTKLISSNTTSAEATLSGGLTAFGTDGFTVGSDSDVNGNGATYAAWNWKANGAGSSNSDGSINSTVSVNTTAGFSIVKFNVGSSGGDITVGHGLGVVPKMIIMKSLDDAYNWDVYHASVVNSKRLVLNTDGSQSNSSYMSSTSPTSSVFTFKQTHYGSNSDAIAYCFAEKKGYSKFGQYTGNGNADGTFIYTGFKPAFILQKRTDNTSNWHIFDNKRETFNPQQKYLLPNTNAAEGDAGSWDFLSNGFKIRSSEAWQNNSGGTYVYMAFAAEPLVANVGSSISATAR